MYGVFSIRKFSVGTRDAKSEDTADAKSAVYTYDKSPVYTLNTGHLYVVPSLCICCMYGYTTDTQDAH